MCNNKKRSRASQTWRGVGAEVCSVNKMKPLMYKRVDFSRWGDDTHIFTALPSTISTSLQKYYTNAIIVGAEEQQREFQTSQICRKDLNLDGFYFCQR